MQSVIQENCVVAMPEGLQELMCDISREVLRNQPDDIYQFISDYLATLMVVRDNISIASRVCSTVCTGSCNPELEDELRYIGLDDENAAVVKKIIEDYFDKGAVNEKNLLTKIANSSNIQSSLLPALQQAIQKAFKRNLIYNNDILYESSSSDSELDDVARAAKHTLRLYRKTYGSTEDYTPATQSVQAAHGTDGVEQSSLLKPASPTQLEEEKIQKNTRFSPETKYNLRYEQTADFRFRPHTSISTFSLAGSYVHLPKFTPYTVHEDTVLETNEETGIEFTTVDYVIDEPSSSNAESHQEIIEDTTLADEESETTIEDTIYNIDDDIVESDPSNR